MRGNKENQLHRYSSDSMIEVRRYRKGEEEELCDICRETTLRINVKEYGAELVGKWVKNLCDSTAWKNHVKNRNPFVAIVDGQIVGFAELSSSGKIGGFYTHHQWQGRGVGSALLGSIENEANSLGLDEIEVESSLSAGQFFKHRGYRFRRNNQIFTDGIPVDNEVLTKCLAKSGR